MTTIQLTYNFGTEHELLEHLKRLAGPVKTCDKRTESVNSEAGSVSGKTVISHADLPSTGQDVLLRTNEVAACNQNLPATAPVAIPFGLSTAEIFTPAPSIAAVGQAPTAPAAPSSTLAAPPAPPAPAAPTGSAAVAPPAPAPPPPPVAGAEVDKHGLPWDARIHASSKVKVADGAWRVRKNLDGATKAAVEAELRQLMALNTAAAPQAPSAPTAPGIVPPAPPVEANPLGALMFRLGPHFASGKLTYAQCDEVVKRHGVQNLTQLVLTPNLVPQVEADLMALVA